jgi:hypothetical protein
MRIFNAGWPAKQIFFSNGYLNLFLKYCTPVPIAIGTARMQSIQPLAGNPGDNTKTGSH